MGGDEFALVLPICTRDDALGVIARMGDAASETSFSVSVAEWVEGEPRISLVARADNALYAAKRFGVCSRRLVHKPPSRLLSDRASHRLAAPGRRPFKAEARGWSPRACEVVVSTNHEAGTQRCVSIKGETLSSRYFCDGP